METNTIITINGNTEELGISIIVIYVMLIIYLVLSTMYNKKLGFALVNPKYGFSLKHLFFNSDITGTSFILALATGLVVWMLTKQRFYISSRGIASIILFVVGSISLLTLFHGHKVIGKTNFLIYVLFTSFAIMTTETYNSKFDRSTLNELYILMYTLITINIMIAIIFGFAASITKCGVLAMLLKDLSGLSNIIYVVTFMFFIYYVSKHPHLEATPI